MNSSTESNVRVLIEEALQYEYDLWCECTYVFTIIWSQTTHANYYFNSKNMTLFKNDGLRNLTVTWFFSFENFSLSKGVFKSNKTKMHVKFCIYGIIKVIGVLNYSKVLLPAVVTNTWALSPIREHHGPHVECWFAPFTDAQIVVCVIFCQQFLFWLKPNCLICGALLILLNVPRLRRCRISGCHCYLAFSANLTFDSSFAEGEHTFVFFLVLGSCVRDDWHTFAGFCL